MKLKLYLTKVVVMLVIAAGTAYAAPPKVVLVSPEHGSKDVNVQTTAITVTFDQDMSKGMSWTGGGPYFPKSDEKRKAEWFDERNCVLPVKLETGQVYRVGLNSDSYQNFKSSAGESLPPETLTFATAGASEGDTAMMVAPKVIEFDPPNESETVSPATSKISVTFDQPMGSGMSWTGGGESFPETLCPAKWSQDQRTCTILVKLKPNHNYQLGINSVSFKNFSNGLGVPAEPISYQFATADK